MPIFTAIGTAVAVGVGATTALGTAGAVAGGSALILGGSGLALTTAGTFIAGATAFGLQMAAGIGLNLLAQQIAGQPQTPAAAAAGSFGVQGRLNAGADVPRSFPFGWRATAGSYVYANTWGKTVIAGTRTPNAFLTQVIALSDLPLRSGADGLVGLWVNGEKVTIEWDNFDSEDDGRGYPVTEYRKGGKDHLWIRFADGTQTTADSFCVARFGANAVRPYQSTRVGTGVAYAVVTSKVNDTLWSGFPQFKFELGSVKLYDISKDTTAGGSGSQRWNDIATWGGDGDDLPAVQLYNLRRGISYDGDWLYGLQAIAGARLPAANWIAQIAKCRAEVLGEDGETNEPTYRSGIEVSVDKEIASTDEALLTACQGRISEVGGFYKLHCGAPDAAVMSFTDDDIISTEEQTFTPFFGLSDTINGITAKYPSPAEGWNTKPAEPLYRSDLEELAGGRRLLADVVLDAVPYARQVQQLMREALQEAQRARRHTFTLPPRFWPLEPGDIVEWTSARNGYVSKLFRVDGVIDKANLDVIVDLTEIDPSDYDFDTATHFVPPTVGPTTPARPPAQAIIDFAATANEVTGDTPGVARPGILLSWDTDDLDDIEGVAFEVRRDSDNEVIIRGRCDQPEAGAVQIEGNGLLPNTDYEVRGRYVPSSARDVDWSGWIAVITTNTRFTFPDFRFAELEHLTSHYEAEIARIKAQIQLIGASSADLGSQAYIERKETRRLLEASRVSLDTRISASIEEVMTVITTNEAAFAAYQLTIASEIEGINSDIAATSATVATHATSISTLQGSVSTLQTTVSSHTTTLASHDSSITSLNASVASQASAITTLEGSVSSLETTVSSHTSTLSSHGSSITSLTASVSSNTSAITTLNGYAAARYTMTLDVNGYATGYELFNGGASYAYARFSVDYFQVAKPGVSGGSPTTVFEIGTVSGSAAIAIKGNLTADGAVVARMMAADSVVANNIQAGAITTAKLDAGAVTAAKIAAGTITADRLFGEGANLQRQSSHGSRIFDLEEAAGVHEVDIETITWDSEGGAYPMIWVTVEFAHDSVVNVNWFPYGQVGANTNGKIELVLELNGVEIQNDLIKSTGGSNSVGYDYFLTHTYAMPPFNATTAGSNTLRLFFRYESYAAVAGSPEMTFDLTTLALLEPRLLVPE